MRLLQISLFFFHTRDRLRIPDSVSILIGPRCARRKCGIFKKEGWVDVLNSHDDYFLLNVLKISFECTNERWTCKWSSNDVFKNKSCWLFYSLSWANVLEFNVKTLINLNIHELINQKNKFYHCNLLWVD